MRDIGIVVILALVAIATATVVILYHGALVASVERPRVSDDGRVFGPALQMGQGAVRGWVLVNEDNTPQEVGVSISEDALIGLPPETPTVFVLDMPSGFDTLPFQHIAVDWNPQGHEPPGVYDVPHFDFHFYMMSNEERIQIGFEDPGFAVEPDAEYIPADYALSPGGVPRMGAHWTDTTAPELNDQPFTHTFIYGSYNGEVTFYEPMITMNFLLQSRDYDVSFDIKQPQAYPHPGQYYPTMYDIRRDPQAQEISVSLGGLVMR